MRIRRLFNEGSHGGAVGGEAMTDTVRRLSVGGCGHADDQTPPQRVAAVVRGLTGRHGGRGRRMEVAHPWPRTAATTTAASPDSDVERRERTLGCRNGEWHRMVTMGSDAVSHSLGGEVVRNTNSSSPLFTMWSAAAGLALVGVWQRVH